MGRPSSSPLGAPGRVRVKRERGLPVVELLPSGMDASIRSDVFARYGILQIENRIDDVGNFTIRARRWKSARQHDSIRYPASLYW